MYAAKVKLRKAQRGSPHTGLLTWTHGLLVRNWVLVVHAFLQDHAEVVNLDIIIVAANSDLILLLGHAAIERVSPSFSKFHLYSFQTDVQYLSPVSTSTCKRHEKNSYKMRRCRYTRTARPCLT